MVRPQGAVFWLVLGALFALLLNAAAVVLPIGLVASPLHALGTAFALAWIGTAWALSPAARGFVSLASLLLLGIQLVGYASGWVQVVAFGALVGMPFWAITAANPIARLPGLGMALPVGSTAVLALATFLAMADVASPADPLAQWGWVYAWGLTVFCVAIWHWWGSDLPKDRMHRAEAVLLGWMGAVLVIPMRLALLPSLPAEHFGILAGVVDGTAIALLFVSAWAARQVASTMRYNERNPQ